MGQRTVDASMKRKRIIAELAAAAEFEALPVREGEDVLLAELGTQVGMSFNEVNEPGGKVLALLNAHFQRVPLPVDLEQDQQRILDSALRVVHGLVDVISTNSLFRQTLYAMFVSQMLVQAVTLGKGSFELLQLPHFDVERCTRLKEEEEIDSIPQLLDLEDDDRDRCLKGLSTAEVAQVADACNRFPYVNLEYDVLNPEKLVAGGRCKINCRLTRDTDDQEEAEEGGEGGGDGKKDEEEEEEVPPVIAPFFPKRKEESWWLMLGSEESNAVLAIKRFTFSKSLVNLKLIFDLPEQGGEQKFSLYLVCDSYVGADKEQEVILDVME